MTGRVRREKRIGKAKSKAFLSQSSQSTRRKEGLKVKGISLTESAEHTEKGWFKRQKLFSQSTPAFAKATARQAEHTEKGGLKKQSQKYIHQPDTGKSGLFLKNIIYAPWTL